MQAYAVPHTSLRISRLAYGIGMLTDTWHDSGFVAKCERGIRAAYDCGITFFDTADVYGGGQSELALGQVLRSSPGLRSKIVLQSKCGIRIREGWDPMAAPGVDSMSVDLSYERIVSAVDGSLKRLNTDWLDILLLHAPSALVEPAEVARAFDELHAAGKVQHFGVCSHSALQLELLRKHVRQPLVVNQMWLGLAHAAMMVEGSAFGALVDYCRLHEIQVQAYSPLKGGSIFGKPVLLAPHPDSPPEVKQFAAMLAAVAAQHGVTPAAIMLAWLLRHPAGVVPIIGAASPEHILQNCAADRVRLSAQEWQSLFAHAQQLPIN